VLGGSSSKSLVKSYKIHLMEMVINAIYYSPLLATRVLEAKGWTNKFFSIWFGDIENFKRVHDKKLCIAAISSLLTLRSDQIPSSVQTGWPRLLTGVTHLFRTLPAAVKQREEAVKTSNDFEGVGDDEDDGDDDTNEDWTGVEDTDWDNDSSATAGDDGGDVKDESQAYLDFLKSEVRKPSLCRPSHTRLNGNGTGREI
jgi:importin-7